MLVSEITSVPGARPEVGEGKLLGGSGRYPEQAVAPRWLLGRLGVGLDRPALARPGVGQWGRLGAVQGQVVAREGLGRED